MHYSHPAVIQSLEHHVAGRNPQARQVLLRALQRDPTHPELLRAAVELAISMNEAEMAENYAVRLSTVYPEWAGAWTLRSQAAVTRQKPSEGVPHAERALALEPGNPDRHRALAWVLHRARRYHDADRAAAAGLALAPEDDDLWRKRIVALQALGRAAQAWSVCGEGLARCPGSLALAESAAMLSNYVPGLGVKDARAAHDRFGALMTATFPPAPPARRTIPPDAPVRVGLVSPDLRGHSVGAFARAIIEHHDPAAVTLYAFDTDGVEDEVMRGFKAALGASRWRTIRPCTPEAVDRVVRAERLDVAIELSGLTQDHNLGVMAGKPAPVGATFIGYPNTTGLAAMDFRIVDGFTDPPGAEALASERLVRLSPCFLCYTPPADPPEITWRPCATPGDRPLVFASFNNLMKLNDELLGTWAGLLAAVPEAELHLKAFGLEDEAVRADVASRCAAAGLPAARLVLAGPRPDKRDHLDAYNRVDVALDAFPYHGTTTTCEALLMGVPVLTIEGDRHASRVGVSLLNSVGVQELITQGPGQLIEVAADLIRDTPRLTRHRRGLRGRLLGSPLCDGASYARGFEAACRAMATGGGAGGERA